MRLGQLARKLAMKPNEIVEFLAEKKIQIEEGSNTKLDANHVALVLTRYAPVQIAEIVEQPPIEKISDETEFSLPSETEIIPPPPAVEEIILNSEVLPTEQIQTDEPSAIIKAPKITLSGLRVLGKIEIPEAKKKEDTDAEIKPVEESALTKETSTVIQPQLRKPYKEKLVRTEQRPRKNPIALAREHEAQEEEIKRRAKIEQEKIKRTQNYQKKVKLAPPTKSMKINNEEVHEMSEADLVDAPKTLWGKFLKWLKK